MSLKNVIVFIGIVCVVLHSVKSASLDIPEEENDSDIPDEINTSPNFDEKNTCSCTREYMSVCASDGKTYPNMCEFECEKAKNGKLIVDYEGDCDGNNIFETDSDDFQQQK